MLAYKENFPVGTPVRIVEREALENFRTVWKYHHKLQPDQLDYAGVTAVVEKIGFYHGGDILYELKEVPGIWHEECLRAA
jgi:hypothetical protein